MIYYIESAKRECANSNAKNAAITRILQVTGECLKDTIETPNVSEEIKTQLIRFFPDNLITTLNSLRNLLTEPNLIHKRNEFLDSENKNILVFLEKASEKFTSILSLKIIEVILNIIKEFPTKRDKLNDQRFCKIVQSPFVQKTVIQKNFRSTSYDELLELKNLAKEVSNTAAGKDLFDKITCEIDHYTELLPNSLITNSNEEVLYKSDLYTSDIVPENIIGYWQRTIIQKRIDIEEYRSSAITVLDFVNILTLLVYAKVHTNSNIHNKVDQIMNKILTEHDRHVSITKLYDFLLDVKQTCKFNQVLPAKEQQCFEKLLKSWENLEKNCFAAKEQVLLDLLETSKKNRILKTDSYFINNYSPSLFGISFRNYLAHGDVLFDLLPLTIDNWANFNYEFIKDIETHQQNLKNTATEEAPCARERCDHHIQLIAGRKIDETNSGNVVGNNSVGNNTSDTNHVMKHTKYNTKKEVDVNSEIERYRMCIKNGSLDKQQLTAFCKTIKDLINKILDSDKNTSLHLSCQYGFANQVNLLLSNKANFNAKNKNGHRPIHLAMLYGKKGIVEILLEHENKNNTCDALLVDVAITCRHLSIFKIFINKFENNELSRALYIAASKDRIDIMRYLISEKKILLESKLINICARNASNRILDYLLSDKMISKIKINQDEKNSILHEAIRSGNINTLKMLLKGNKKLNLDVNAKNHAGYTALHIAVELNRIEMVKYLKDKAADVNEVNNNMRTPLHLAALSGNVSLFDTLLRCNRIKIDVQDAEGFSVLHFAALLGLESVVMKLLEKSRKEKITIVDLVTNGLKFTALHCAVDCGSERIAKLLIQECKDINKKDKYGYSVLHLAAMKGNPVVFECLCGRSDLDLNAKDNNGMTPLHIALNFRNVDIAMGLIQRRVELNEEDCHKWTPLHYAVAHNLRDAVGELLKSGATQTDEICVALYFDYDDDMIKILLNENNVNRSWNKDFPITSLGLVLSKSNSYKNKRNKRLERFDAILKVVPPKTPLSFAISNGNTNVMQSMLGKHSHKKLKKYFKLQSNYKVPEITPGSTPLHLAVKNGNIDTIRLLLDKNADVTLRDQNQKTPKALARQTADPNIRKLLL